MKYHLTLDGKTAACGLINQRPDTFLYDLTGFNAHYAKQCECKKCKQIAATMPTKGNWPIETSNNLYIMKTPEEFIKEYYDFDSENFEPQVPFVHLSFSDLVELLNAWSLQDSDSLYVAFAEWVNDNYRGYIGTGWYHKDDSDKHFKEVTYYTMQELFNIFRNEPTTELPNNFWQNEYEKLRREFAELQGDELILIGKIKQLEADIEDLTIK